MNLPEPWRGGAALPPGGGLPAALQASTANPAYPMVDGTADRIDFGSVLGALKRRRVLILSILAAFIGMAFVITLVLPRSWSAAADIVVEPGRRELRVAPGEEATALAPDSSGLIETELETLRSRSLAAKVFDQLKLASDPVFMAGVRPQPSTVDRLQASLGLSAPIVPASAADLRERAIARLAENITANRVGTSYVLRITATASHPLRAARIANAYVSAFIGERITGQAGSNRDAIRVLSGRVDELRAQAQTDTTAVQDYRIRNNLLSKSATSLTEQEISSYNQSLANARAEAAEARTRLSAARAQLAAAGTGAVGEAGVSATVQALRSQRASLSTQVADLSNRYVDTYPDLVAARRKLEDIDQQIDAEVNRALRTLEARAEAAQGRLASLEGSLGNARNTLRGNNQALTQLGDLERRAEASQQLYESYLNRYKEVVAKSGAEEAGARPLTAATPPKRPSAPSMPLNLALGAVFGLLFGTVAAVSVENLYRGLTAGSDVEKLLGVRYLGGVPLIKSLEHNGGTSAETIAKHPGGVYAEALRGVLMAARAGGSEKLKVIAVTSGLPSEGKSTMAAGLARVGAMGGERTVLVDCDAVKSRVARDLGIPAAHPGMADIVHDNLPVADAGYIDPVGGATVLAFTRPLADGERLLDRGRLQRLVAQLKEEYDLIILDCGPLLAIAETRQIATLADHVIVAARWRFSRADVVLTALKMLPWGVVRSVGVALTMVDLRRQARLGGNDATAFYRKYSAYYG
jgi:polysaccharide biosynthesis transport protein